MKLTKKQEAEILKVYHIYWDSYLKGDVEIMLYKAFSLIDFKVLLVN